MTRKMQMITKICFGLNSRKALHSFRVYEWYFFRYNKSSIPMLSPNNQEGAPTFSWLLRRVIDNCLYALNNASLKCTSMCWRE